MDRELRKILKGVSRSIYLSIRILPKKLRDPVGIAYLFCRTADTIADTNLIPPEERLAHLSDFRAHFGGLEKLHPPPVRLRRTMPHPPGIPSSEWRLMQSLNRVFSAYHSFAPPIRRIIADLVTELTLGMEMDLKIFADSGNGVTVHALPDRSALERYTYYVAGVVGRFWTAVLMELEPRCRLLDRERMTGWGIRYGQGLQLINILRDLPRDLARGRCYLPADELRAVGLRPDSLFNRKITQPFQDVYGKWVEQSRAWLEEGDRYLAALPRRLVRVRTATALPLQLGYATLDLLKNNPRVLDPRVQVKIPRWKVYASLLTPRR